VHKVPAVIPGVARVGGAYAARNVVTDPPSAPSAATVGASVGARADEAVAIAVAPVVLDVLHGPDAGRRATGDAITVGTSGENQLVLTDLTVSRRHLSIAIEPAGGIAVTDLGSSNGTYVGGVRIRSAVVPAGTVLQLGNTRLRVEAPADVALRAPVSPSRHQLVDLCGGAPSMLTLYSSIERLAQGRAAALITGESGTGKELAAHALHTLGPRAGGPFVTVDCGALAPTLASSELFGHERGSFTGAERQHVGAFERAQGGTLLLDEIGELPPEQQATLLGVLERRRFRRVGGRDELAMDVRVLAATHRDLRAAAEAGTFRLDLYYRLAVVKLHMPPLRERREDIPRLVEHFLRQLGHQGPVAHAVPTHLMAALVCHDWPGNVRELRNVVEALLLGEPPAFERARPMSSPPIELDPEVQRAVLDLPYREARSSVTGAFELQYLQRLLDRAQGNVSQAARLARMDRSYLLDLLARHGLRNQTLPATATGTPARGV
jgi:DNA-binding NtrC family response regulator